MPPEPPLLPHEDPALSPARRAEIARRLREVDESISRRTGQPPVIFPDGTVNEAAAQRDARDKRNRDTAAILAARYRAGQVVEDYQIAADPSLAELDRFARAAQLEPEPVPDDTQPVTLPARRDGDGGSG
jgi:hypothetical protein